MRRYPFALVLCVLLVWTTGCGNQFDREAAPSGESAAKAPRMYESASPPPSAGEEAPGAEAPPAEGEPQPAIEHNTEAYDHVEDNPFVLTAREPLSTFAVDVDTASYSNVRRFLSQNQLPPKGAVRVEELVNYFDYDYAPPADETPFAVHVETAGCPWQPDHRLVRVALKGRIIEQDQRPPSNLVFLIDCSGSMSQPNKLPLVKAALNMLVERLGAGDRVAIAAYAGGAGLVLPSTPADQTQTIRSAIQGLSAGGSTHGSAGINLAYRQAQDHFIQGGTNRVILCTDGDFNVGTTNQSDLVALIEEKAKDGVFLSVLGFGMGNYKDSTMEKLADHGNGNYAYIDTGREARKVFVEQMSGTLVTIAKDVKIQVDFNPAQVAAYRLIGYENRMLRAEDFLDDQKDAGDIGAGHAVTAFYEIVPPGAALPVPEVEASKYAADKPAVAEGGAADTGSDELLTVRLRYKQPDADVSEPLRVPVTDNGATFDKASTDFRFAAAVAEFGMLLRDSPHKGNASFAHVLATAKSNLGQDSYGYRGEFVELAETAQQLKGE